MTTIETPINISSQNIYGKCELKCMYSFKYTNSNCTATNNNTLIILSYDKNSTPPVSYNNNKYEVSQIQICAPSFHLFNGSKTSAEIMISHTPILGGKELIVCLPIIQNNNITNASNILSEIVQIISRSAPKNGDSANINLTNYTLQSIISNKPFYNYTTNINDYVVFDIEHAIGLSSEILNILTSIIQPNINVAMGGNLFYNSLGSNVTNEQDNEIYISCQPTGNSETNINVTYEKTPILNDILNNDVFTFLIICIVLIITLMLLNYLITYIGSIKYF